MNPYHYSWRDSSNDTNLALAVLRFRIFVYLGYSGGGGEAATSPAPLVLRKHVDALFEILFN